MSKARLQSDDIAVFTDEHSRRIARSKGKSIYKGTECNIPGHGVRRYVATTGCVVCSDARARAKARRTASTPRGVSSTREYRLWAGARKRAEDKGLPFTITIDDIVIPDVCPVFGTPLTQPSLDRFNNDRGYTPDNVRVISRRANTIKSDATLAEIKAVTRYMENESGDDFSQLLG